MYGENKSSRPDEGDIIGSLFALLFILALVCLLNIKI